MHSYYPREMLLRNCFEVLGSLGNTSVCSQEVVLFIHGEEVPKQLRSLYAISRNDSCKAIRYYGNLSADGDKTKVSRYGIILVHCIAPQRTGNNNVHHPRRAKDAVDPLQMWVHKLLFKKNSVSLGYFVVYMANLHFTL